MAVYSGADYIDPDNFLWQAYHSSQAGFWAAASHYMNPEFDKILEDARADTNQENRKALYDEAQLMLVNDAVEIWVYTEIPNESLGAGAQRPVYARSWAATCGRSATSRSRCLNFGARRRQEIAFLPAPPSGT